MVNSKRAYLIDRAPLPFFALVVDAIIILFSGWLAYLLRFQDLPVAERYWWAVSTLMLLLLLMNSSFDGYKHWRSFRASHLLGRLLMVWSIVAIASAAIIYFFQLSTHFSRLWLCFTLTISFSLAVAGRIAAKYILSRYHLRGRQRRSVFLVGPGDILLDVSRKMRTYQREGYSIKGIQRIKDSIEPHEVEAIARRIGNSQCVEVWICLPLSMGREVKTLVRALRFLAINVRFFPEFSDLPLLNHHISQVVGLTSIDISVSPMNGGARILKRTEDIVLSSAILVMISPILIALAVGVKLSSPGPIFYRQERVSSNGKPFNMLKFRSMAVNSEEDGVKWGGASKKAVTRFGSFIRRTSLDELPQFINVLLGDMSIVGPRPERSIFVKQFQYEIPRYMQKHMVKAGITGWAQINGFRGDTSLDKRVEYDLWYIENWSLWLDIKIIMTTAVTVFFDKQAV